MAYNRSGGSGLIVKAALRPTREQPVMRLPPVTLLLALMVGGLACSSASSTDEVRVDLDAMQLSEQDQRVVWQAQNEVLRQCMTEKGFDLITGEFVPVEQQESGFYGLDDLERAEQYGYRRTPEEVAEDAAINDQIAEEEAAVPPGYRDALLGQPVSTDDDNLVPSDESCMAQATRELKGGLGEVWDTEVALQNSVAQALNSAQDSAASAEVMEDWSLCMRERGFDIPDVHEAFRFAIVEYEIPENGGGEPHEAEIALAMADVECKVAVNLEDRLQEIEENHVQEFIAENEALVIANIEIRGETVRRAQEVMDEMIEG